MKRGTGLVDSVTLECLFAANHMHAHMMIYLFKLCTTRKTVAHPIFPRAVCASALKLVHAWKRAPSAADAGAQIIVHLWVRGVQLLQQVS